MESKNPRTLSRQASEKSVNFEDKSDSSPVVAKTSSAGIGRSRTEVPVMPASVQEIPRVARDDMVPIGNKKYELALRLKGNLGHFVSRENTIKPYVDLPLQTAKYRVAVRTVLKHVLTKAQRMKSEMTEVSIENRINLVSKSLTDGIMVMTYLKLRAINLFRNTDDAYLLKPKVPAHFEVPKAFGYAISQLGIVEVSSLPKRKICVPNAATADCKKFLLTYDGARWSQAVYAESVEFAKSLGMQFNTVDLDVKVGSAWWLFKQVSGPETPFALQCPLPEDNYTEAAAALHTLFCNDGADGLANEIFDLSELGDDDYGTFIRGPRDDISYSTYYAITGELGEEAWRSSS